VSLVLDSSVTLAWIYTEETASEIREILNQVADYGAWVPALWRLEVGNILEIGVRRKRHDAAFRDATLSDLLLLPLYVDSETDQRAWGPILRLAERHQLTLYDAAYLELAQRRGLPLATLDGDLRRAATLEKIPLRPA
jgi:Predicted nucleic acid-binding protein, contains PIN domain